ncbi:MAG: UDP-glucose 4-epimerase GalE [Rhodobacteraceae bacterium]|nr:UDP-glucose 4-epimerase GalE [Paracoccaceae bacterium]
MSVLVTGGAGYIGSHCCVTFLEAGHDVVVLDNLSNSSAESLTRVAELTGRSVHFEQCDIRDRAHVETILRKHSCESVVHFAGLKAVGESVEDPLRYYENNVGGTVQLLSAMQACNVKTIIFSSSATVYGEPQSLPLREDHPTAPLNPYGESKLMVEQILKDLKTSDPEWRIAILRYFNPTGAHASGLIGEDPRGVPNNLMPFISQVASGRREVLSIFGDDYPTEDGTGVRDYIHVVDLVEGHLKAHEALIKPSEQLQANTSECLTVNLGTGTGYSVQEMVRAFERASNRAVATQIAPRRAGDSAEVYASTQKASDVLDWTAGRGLQDMCHDTWNWVCKNPKGYDDSAE